MGRNDNAVATILSILIVCVFLVTVYFCLDLFNIIEVPEQYSIAKFLDKRMTEVSVALPTAEIINEDTIDEWINQESEEIEEQNTTVIEDEVPIEERPNNYYEDYIEQQNANANIPEENVENTKTSANVVNRMYYSQLDIYGKMIYDRINDNRDQLKTGTFTADFDTLFDDLLHEENGEQVLESAFQHSINALLFDNPEIFYIDITKIYMSTEITSFGPFKTYRVKIGPLEGEDYFSEFFHNEEIVNIAIDQFEKAKEEVKSRVYGDIDTQIKVVHDYIIENTEYDQTLSQSNIYTAYGALNGKLAVCEGYAKALKYILDDLGIPCVIACGIATNSNGKTESHAWNYVKIDDKWYAVDTTWDDPLIVGDGYVSQDIYKRYFLKGSNDFFKDHFEDGKIVEGSNFVYPTISEENYN